MTDYRELVTTARSQIREIAAEEAEEMAQGGVLIDVREPDEHRRGYIGGAVLAPLGTLLERIDEVAPDRSVPLVLYCSTGARSALGAKALQDLGYGNVASLAGGLVRWQEEGRPWEAGGPLTTEQLDRYSRQIALDEVGLGGQVNLSQARVLVVGAGGLGSPAALYLAAAGVGTLGIVDGDEVELSNLQRQVVHDQDGIGRPKADSARERLQRLNSDVEIRSFAGRLHAGNVREALAAHDVVVDGSDNFPTRYLINDASIHTGVPVVHGSVFRFEGQVSVFVPYEGPCYRCLYPQPPPPALAPNCEDVGVLGAVSGVVGALQATEALKMVLGVGEPLVGRLLLYDALAQETRTVNVRRDPACPACGDPGRPPPLKDYDDSCV